MINDSRNPWSVELLDGPYATVGPHDFHVTVREHFTLGDTVVNAVDGFRNTQVNTLVIATEPRRDFEDLGIPTVLENARYNTIEEADPIGSDQVQEANPLMGHLHSLGHRHIGRVTDTGGSADIHHRVYSDFVESAGLEPLMNRPTNPTSEESDYLGTAELLRTHPGPTTVFMASDTMALKACVALRGTGYEVPGDASPIDFDNSQPVRSRFLDLTTMDNHAFDVGVAYTEALLHWIADPNASPRHITIPINLVTRTPSAIPGT